MAAAPTPPAASPIPLAGGDYASAAALAGNAYQNALAQINSQRQSALQQYGYQGTIDPTTGTLTNMQVDPNNPYGQYQQMLAAGASNLSGVQASDMARGLGAVSGDRGGGLAAQGLTAAHQAFGADSANLGQSLMSTLGDLQGQQTNAQDTMNNALWQAELDAAQNAIQNQQFDTADMSGVTDQPIDGGKVPGADTIIQPESNLGVGYGSNPPNIGGHSGVKVARNRAARQQVAAHRARQTAARKPTKGRR